MDIAVAEGRNMRVSAVLISEPNKQAIHRRKDWVHDNMMDTAIKILDASLVITDKGHGTGFTYVSTAHYTIYSCYSSGNKEIQELETCLNEIGNRIKFNRECAIITGDFNAKSPQWGMNYTDQRGAAMTDWIAENNLIVVNEGDKPTFQRSNQFSILDLTIVTEDIRTKVHSWQVRDEESLSDHRFIVFEVNETMTSRKRPCKHTGWKSKNINTEKLQQALSRIEIRSNTTTVEGYTEVLHNVCNQVMPKQSSRHRNQPVYWWNEQIAKVRKECIASRRHYTRSAKKSTPTDLQTIWKEYLTKKKELQRCIKRSKRTSWRLLCDEVDKDVWGKGYEIVMKGMTGFPPRTQLSCQFTKQVVHHLFPSHLSVTFESDTKLQLPPFTEGELKIAAEKLKGNRAPGPGKIPAEILKELAGRKPQYMLQVYNQLAEKGIFPEKWKRAVLVLLKKGDKPVTEPSAYRPICLLDSEGKLYEQLLTARLKEQLFKRGGLSNNQYGFREGRQTVDAIQRVINVAKGAAEYSARNRRLCAMVTLDVKNAFNNASWQLILESMRRKGIEESLITVVASYLSQRKILLQAEGTTSEVPVSSGVPQGSVLGPTLWNILYDDLLETEQSDDILLIGFADDVALLAIAKTEDTLMTKTNAALARIARWILRRQLQLAPEKTEAVLLTTKRKIAPVQFEIQGTTVRLSSAIKYLGVWLDTKLTFNTHIDKTIQKAEKTLKALSSIMPSVGGPRASKRKILSSVVHSQLLYAAPVWSDRMTNKGMKKKIIRIQRSTLIRVVSSYRTISAEAVAVIAGVPPIDLLARERKERYIGKNPAEAREELLARWQQRWQDSPHGRWTFHLIPDIKSWIEREYGEVDYFLTQAISGHGCFRKFLFYRNRAASEHCPYCQMTDDANHTLFVCEKWREIRQKFKVETGKEFNAESVSTGLTSVKALWVKIYSTIRYIVEKKERDLREYA